VLGIDYLILVAQMCRDVYQHTPGTIELGVKGIHDFGSGSDYGCVYVTPTTLFVVVAGTDDRSDWMSNLKATKRGEWYGVKGHRGFIQGARALEPAMLDIILRYPDHDLVFAGHSRGGAIALLLAISAEFWHEHRHSRTITYGQPRVSTERQIRLAYRRGEYVRIVNGSDAVPRYPNIGYSHAGTLFYITNGDDGYRIDPGHVSMFCDRALTVFSRGRDHSIAHYIEELEKCKSWR
jgi:hypothetical protein